MNKNQKQTPKYWIGHDKRTDDVFLNTARKDRDSCVVDMKRCFGEDCFMDDNFEVILIEIKEV